MTVGSILLPLDGQPQEAVSLDWGHPGSRGIVLAQVGSNALFDVARGRVGSIVGIAGMGASVGGLGPYFSPEPAAGASIPIAPTLDREFSMLVGAAPTAAASIRTLLALRGSGANLTRSLAANMSWSGPGVAAGRLGLFVPNATGSWYTSAQTAATVIDGRFHVFGASKAAGVAPRLYVDGIDQTANTYLFNGTNPGFLSDVVSVRIGGAQHDPTPNPYTDSSGIAFAFLWNRALTPAEFAAYSADPWQLFEPRALFVTRLTGAAAPALSAADLIDLGATTARPTVTLTY